ncbi:MAG: 2-dehydro-3-deoxygalactonokinase [Rhodovulum sp.]|nr:2-dehydro-3-deoxygalactonokinase [Rhodovulum sp.]
MTQAHWIAVDWRADGLTVWPMGDGDAVLDQIDVPLGAPITDLSGFCAAILPHVEPFLSGTTPVVVGGAPVALGAGFVPVPCKPAELSPVVVTAGDPRLSIHLIPTVSQDQPADILQGTEALIAGYIADHPNFDGILCIPGPATKWCHISAEEIVSFQSFVSSELIAALAPTLTNDFDRPTLLNSVQDAMSNPHRMASRLATLRAEQVLNPTDASDLAAGIAGTVIGVELAGARAYWLGQMVVVLGDGVLSEAYLAALQDAGAMVERASVDSLIPKGLTAIRIDKPEAD